MELAFRFEVLLKMDSDDVMRFFLASILALIGVSALAEDDYFPLAGGNEWILEQVADSFGGHARWLAFYQKIQGTVQNDGKTYFRSWIWSQLDGMPPNLESECLIRKDEKAIYSFDTDNGDSVEQVAFVLPLKVGSKWENLVAKMPTRFVVIGIESVEASGETYENCYHIQSISADGKYAQDWWQAPNIGTVKKQITNQGSVRVIYALKKFKPGK